MTWRDQWKSLLAIVGGFLLLFFLPVGNARFEQGVREALVLSRWYAREHVLLCLVPAFFIAGAISTFVSQTSVLKYLGARANRVVAYGVAGVSGTVIAVCSCTILPLFTGIYRMGAGIGPATAFLYSGPAISVLAIILTGRVLGWEFGAARAVAAVGTSVFVGLAMAALFREEEAEREAQMALPELPGGRPLWQTATHLALLVGILVFANWGKPATDEGLWHSVWAAKWWVTSAFAVGLAAALVAWFDVAWWKVTLVAVATLVAAILTPTLPIVPFVVASLGVGLITSLAEEGSEVEAWFEASWDFAKQIMPLLLLGVLAAGALFGSPAMDGLAAREGWIPNEWVARLVGGESLSANFLAAASGAFMYFATLTEVPILRGLVDSGMGQGPALALALAGPSLSLPSILVIYGVLGAKKTAAYVMLCVLASGSLGFLYGQLIAGGAL
ncbi:MAG: permease [Planctomycetota bacterium]